MKIKFIILGCGSSFRVLRGDGTWGKCNPKEKKITELDVLLLLNLILRIY